MPKTWLTVLTALVACLVSLGLIAARRAVLGPEIDGTPGTSSWAVTLEATGDLADENGTLTLFLPPDFRRQHIADEHFDSQELTARARIRKGNGPRRVVWQRRAGVRVPGRFRLTYTWRTVLGMRRPTAAMVSRSQAIDDPPPDGAFTRPSARIESDDADIANLAGQLVPEDSDPEDVVRSAFDHVVHLGPGTGPDSVSARACLLQAGGDPAGKARLVVALCRNRGVPARLVQGLVLNGDGPAASHAWAEAWVQGHWQPVDPTHGHFGARRFPGNYLVLHVGDDDLLQGHGARARLSFRVTDLHNGFGADPPGPPSLLRSVYRRLTPGNLRPEDQQLVQFLLLLPVAALVVCVFRVVIGLTTYGTFGPALLGLVCRDLHDLPWALGVFVLIMLGGWVMRRMLDSYHLLMVPRVAVLLTGVIGTLIITLMLVSSAGLAVGPYLALLPLIILTHMVERFWTLEAEDGTAASFRTLVATILVAATVSLVVNGEVLVNGAARLLGGSPLLPPNALRATLLRYPEALGLVLAAQLLLGRYTGYRLTELYRFKDLLLEDEPTGGSHELAATRPGPDGPGHPRDEPAQHRVHSGP